MGRSKPLFATEKTEESKGKIFNTILPSSAKEAPKAAPVVEKEGAEDVDDDWGAVPVFAPRKRIYIEPEYGIL